MAATAFADPATLSEFVNFVRSKGEELKARAVISIVPKSRVAFPQVIGRDVNGGGVTSLGRQPLSASRPPGRETDSRRPHAPRSLSHGHASSHWRAHSTTPLPPSQIWASCNLWPYSREQDGVFVQLQALCPQTAAPSESAVTTAGGKSSDKGSKARRQQTKDTAKTEQGDQKRAATQVEKVWFVRIGDKVEGGGFKVRTSHELPKDLALLPSLLR